MTMKTLIQQFCGRTGVPVPTTVYGSTDTQVLQLLRGLEEIGMDLVSRGPWQQVTREATLVTLAQEDQGTIQSICTDGFNYLLWGTLWDRSNRRPLFGPKDAQDWQWWKAMTFQGPNYSFRIRGDKFLVMPVPTAGWTWAMEYVSKNWILAGGSGSTNVSIFGSDADTCLLPEEYLLMGLRWWWKKEKELDYEEDFRTYENNVANFFGRSRPAPDLHMDGEAVRGPTPGIFVPFGSWPLH